MYFTMTFKCNCFFCSKFWARNRPGDAMSDKYNLDTQGSQEDGEYSTFTNFLFMLLFTFYTFVFTYTIKVYLHSDKIH